MITVKPKGSKASWKALVSGPGYMGISLYSQNHRGAALLSMIDWINHAGKFSSFRIGLSDTLNRFNTAHMKGIDLSAARYVALKAGDEWLEENAEILERLNMPYDIVRWSHWLDNYSAEIALNLSFFKKAFETVDAFKAAVLKDIEAYARRNHDKYLPELTTAEFQASYNYLMEELAVYSVILKVFPATTVYPGRQLYCFAYIREHSPSYLPNAIGKTGFIRLGIHGTDLSSDPFTSSERARTFSSAV